MENEIFYSITKEVLFKTMSEQLPKLLDEMFSRGYSNPLKDVLEAEMKNVDGEIKKLVKETISEVLTNPEFKSKLSEKVIEKIITTGLKI